MVASRRTTVRGPAAPVTAGPARGTAGWPSRSGPPLTGVVARLSPPGPPVSGVTARPGFARILAGFALVILAALTAATQRYLSGTHLASAVLPVLLALALAGVTSPLWCNRAERMQFGLTGIIAVVVAVPLNRAGVATRTELLAYLVVIVLLAVPALAAGCTRFCPRTVVLATTLFAVMIASTALAASTSGWVKAAASLGPGIAAFTIAGRLPRAGRRNVAIAVVSLAAAEALIAIPEPFLYAQRLYPAVAANGQSYPESNLIPGLLRAQATLGHPLTLGLLLVLAIALLLRVIEPPGWIRWPLVGLFVGGTITAGARNSLILAGVLVLLYPRRRLTAARILWCALIGAIGLMVGVALGAVSFGFLHAVAVSGSFTHRVGALDSFGRLLSRQDLVNVALGNGFGGIPTLFDGGLLQNDGLEVVDNQFIAQFGQAGLVGMVALAVLVLLPLFRHDWHWRAATMVVLTNSMILDWMIWSSSAALALFVLGSAFAAADELFTEPGRSAAVAADPTPPSRLLVPSSRPPGRRPKPRALVSPRAQSVDRLPQPRSPEAAEVADRIR